MVVALERSVGYNDVHECLLCLLPVHRNFVRTFRDKYNVRQLRICNVHDFVPKVPGACLHVWRRKLGRACGCRVTHTSQPAFLTTRQRRKKPH